jgi:hypothetical protein
VQFSINHDGDRIPSKPAMPYHDSGEVLRGCASFGEQFQSTCAETQATIFLQRDIATKFIYSCNGTGTTINNDQRVRRAVAPMASPVRVASGFHLHAKRKAKTGVAAICGTEMD